MRTIVWACVLAISLAPRGFAAPAAEDVRKIIAERCARVERFSIVCDGLASTVRSGPWTYCGLRFTFDRATRRLASGYDGLPALLVQDRRMFFLLSHDQYNEKETLSYVEVKQDCAVAWRDVAAAVRLMKKEGEPYGYDCCCCVYDAYKDVSTCFLAPFLEGGIDELFSKSVQPLYCDVKLFAGDMEELPKQREKAAQQLMEAQKLSEVECGIFVLGHPDYELMPPLTKKRRPLAPEKFPLCFKTKDDSSSWVYAFNHESGVFLGLAGTVDQERVFGSPGNKVYVCLKAYPLKDSDELKPMPLELPKNATVVGIADLKSTYRRMLSEMDLEETLNRKAYEEEELQKVTREESDLTASLARLSANPKTDRKTLEELQSQLALTQGVKKRYAYNFARVKRLIEMIEQVKDSKPSRKGIAAASGKKAT